MQSDKFTAIVRNAIGAAQTAALSANHQKLTGEHILLALLEDDNMTVKMLISKAGGDAGAISKAVDAALAKLLADATIFLLDDAGRHVPWDRGFGKTPRARVYN